MGTAKDEWLEGGGRRYASNRYNKQVQKLRERIRRYAHAPSFVAKLQRELDDLKARRKIEVARDKKRRAGLRELSQLTQEFGGYDAELK